MRTPRAQMRYTHTREGEGFARNRPQSEETSGLGGNATTTEKGIGCGIFRLAKPEKAEHTWRM